MKLKYTVLLACSLLFLTVRSQKDKPHVADFTDRYKDSLLDRISKGKNDTTEVGDLINLYVHIEPRSSPDEKLHYARRAKRLIDSIIAHTKIRDFYPYGKKQSRCDV